MRTMIFDGEYFEECKSYPSYFCSKSGRVISVLVRGHYEYENFQLAHELSDKIDKDGYCELTFKVNNQRITRRKHRIIAEQFLENYSNELVVNHKNGFKQDNRIENLEMVTVKENTIHAWEHGLCRDPNCAKPCNVIVNGQSYYFSSMKQLRIIFPEIPIIYLQEIYNNNHIKYSRMCFEKEKDIINCYVNGEIYKQYKSNKDIATEFNKKPNTISKKIHNVKDYIYKNYTIKFDKCESTIENIENENSRRSE